MGKGVVWGRGRAHGDWETVGTLSDQDREFVLGGGRRPVGEYLASQK